MSRFVLAIEPSPSPSARPVTPSAPTPTPVATPLPVGTPLPVVTPRPSAIPVPASPGSLDDFTAALQAEEKRLKLEAASEDGASEDGESG